MIELAPSCQTIAFPSTAPEAKILEFLEANKLRMADFGFAFCFFIKFLSFHIYKYPSEPPVMAISFKNMML